MILGRFQLGGRNFTKQLCYPYDTIRDYWKHTGCNWSFPYLDIVSKDRVSGFIYT